MARLIADVLTTRVADEALDGFAGDANVSVVVVTGGAPEDDERKVNHG